MICRRSVLRLGGLIACFGLFGPMARSGSPAAAAPAGSCEVFNAGHGGDNTADLLARLDRDVLTRAPDVVILLAGTNDLLNSRNAVSLEKYHENLRALVRRISAKGAGVLLMTLPPAYPPYLLKRHPAEFYGAGGPAERIAAGNAVIREVARENHVPVVDVFAALSAAGGASALPASLIRNEANSGAADGVHPTAAGYHVIAGAVADVLARENLTAARRIICLGDSITFGVHVKGEGTATGETYPAYLLQALGEKFPTRTQQPGSGAGDPAAGLHAR